MNHTIMMISHDDGTKVTYKNVVSYTGLYGCFIQLELEDGTTATFDKENWSMFDLTPTKGWNCNASEIEI